jgi:hypothetical protein
MVEKRKGLGDPPYRYRNRLFRELHDSAVRPCLAKWLARRVRRPRKGQKKKGGQ